MDLVQIRCREEGEVFRMSQFNITYIVMLTITVIQYE